MNEIPDSRVLKDLHQCSPVNISFENLFYTVATRKGNKNILNGISGNFESQQMTAILGPSGAGKSSLLDVLAGLRRPTSGTVYVNNINRDSVNFRKMSRYIMQEDLCQKMLTVKESMMIAADLKLGYSFTKKEKTVIIDEILNLLRLSKASNTIGNYLSGGELKRLSIALELVHEPPILILDEPTTGLDDLSCSQCIQLLQGISKGRHCCIIFSIHSPSAKIFAMFDHVYFLADGNCIYRGTGNGIVKYAQKIGLECPINYNPADFLIEASCGEYGQQYVRQMISDIDRNCPLTHWIDHNKTLDTVAKYLEINIKSLKANSTNWEQFCVLLKRNFTQIFRNKTHLKLKFYMHVLLGLLVGTSFYNIGNDASKTIYNFGFCFTVIIAFMYIPLMPILLEFPSDIRLLKREHFNQWYRLIPYYFSLVISKMPIQLGLGLTYLSIIYFLTDQPVETERILKFYSISLLVFLVSESFAMVVASRLNILHSMFTGPVLLVPLMLLSVYNIGNGITNVPSYVRVLMSTSYLRFGLEGLIDAIYGNFRADMECPNEEVFCPYKKPAFLRKVMGFENINFFTSIMALIAFYVVFNCLAFYLIRRRVLRLEFRNKFLKRITHKFSGFVS